MMEDGTALQDEQLNCAIRSYDTKVKNTHRKDW